MKRRDFLHKLGIGAAACAIVPIIETQEEPFTVEKLNDACEELNKGAKNDLTKCRELLQILNNICFSNSTDEEAQKSITEFDGAELDCRTIKCNEAKPQEPRQNNRW